MFLERQLWVKPVAKAENLEGNSEANEVELGLWELSQEKAQNNAAFWFHDLQKEGPGGFTAEKSHKYVLYT